VRKTNSYYYSEKRVTEGWGLCWQPIRRRRRSSKSGRVGEDGRKNKNLQEGKKESVVYYRWLNLEAFEGSAPNLQKKSFLEQH